MEKQKGIAYEQIDTNFPNLAQCILMISKEAVAADIDRGTNATTKVMSLQHVLVALPSFLA